MRYGCICKRVKSHREIKNHHKEPAEPVLDTPYWWMGPVGTRRQVFIHTIVGERNRATL